jgi:protein involved in polysaccharide export with SLBB domain
MIGVRLIMRKLLSIIGLLILISFGVGSLAETQPVVEAQSPSATGDRVVAQIKSIDGWIPAALSREDYRIGPGDTLSINVQGKATLNYHVRPNAETGSNPDEVSVGADGNIYIPLVGKLEVAGKTIAEVEDLIRSGLSNYIKNFEVAISVSKVRTINVWFSGEVNNPGPQILPAVSTVSLAVLQVGIKPTGSTRHITLIRNGEKRTVDLFKMTLTGSIDEDIPLEPGDSIHVPAVTDFVEISGEVNRAGQYEMVGIHGGSQAFRICDLLELASGTLPSTALDKCVVERIGADGKIASINVNLSPQKNPNDLEMVLQPGDKVMVFSISAFQPMIRLIGEFRGEGVYQRTPGATEEAVENKSGIYYLRQGQTVGDVIVSTGGVTPQADLKRARIERKENGAVRMIPVDLEQLLIAGDKTADMALANGDTLVLPAVVDRVHVFGEVNKQGSYVYSPNRSLIDYIGGAGGPTQLAKLTDVSVVRGAADSPKIARYDVKSAMRSSSKKGNPVLEPGDIVYIPSKIVSGWRDTLQLVFSALSLNSLLKR